MRSPFPPITYEEYLRWWYDANDNAAVQHDASEGVRTEKKMARDMTSVLEKVELLKSVGAEELADQALLKVMQLEIDRLQQEQ